MDFIEIAKKRFSSRNYSDQPIEEEKLKAVLDAGRIAPSASNKQAWIFVVVKQKENLEKVYKSSSSTWIQTAPVLIIICGDHRQSWIRVDGKDHCDIDAAVATDHMTLEATDQGLATCWVCNFDKKELADALDLPEHIEPEVILPIGYPLDHKEMNRHIEARKPLDKIIYYERFK